MNFKQWKLGCFVSLLTGFFTAFVIGAVIPEARWKTLLFILLGSMGKDFLLYVKDHPVDNIK